MDVNWWAIIVAAIVKFVIGGIWYMPLFGKQYRELMGVPEGSDMSGIGPAPFGRWQFWQLRCRIGAMSLAKVTCPAPAVC